MPKLIKAKYHPDLKVAEFIADDGRHLLRAGGTLPWRINNGGDLVSPTTNGQPSPKKTKDYIGFAAASERHFFIFPDYETGRREMLASLKRQHSGKTIPELTNSYVKEGAEANTKYADRLLGMTNIAKDKKLGEFSEAELNALADGIEQLEGYHNEKDSRKEIWVPVSRITATDGAYTLPDEEISVVIQGKETTLKSNAVGQFPPIPHADSPIEVKHRTPDGNLKSVGTIEGDQSKSYNLISQVRRFFGQTAPDKPTEPKQTKRQPFAYTVQPRDTLAKIAARFQTSVQDIKRDNQRTNDKLFAGEVIGIYAPLSGQQVPARPKPTPKRPAAPASTAAAASAPPAAKAKAAKPPPPAHQVDAATRSDEGSGKPLAVLAVDANRAPWMRFAIAEAKHFKGMKEDKLQDERNYHKILGTGRKTLVGSSNAWCAAFVSWCLLQDRRAIGAPNAPELKFKNVDASKGRANSFAMVHGPNSDPGGDPDTINPNFTEISQPIFGAIAMVHEGGPGHHVGFVYAKHGLDHLVVLGGNQKDQINFSELTTKFVPGKRKKNENGKWVIERAPTPGLRYFVPASYTQYKDDIAKNDLTEESADALNRAFGIEVDKKTTLTTR